jgi:predicted lactoylglutathione lyase
MVIIKADKKSEAGVMPSEKLLTEMGKFNDELVEAGIMLGGEGLHPSSAGKRVRFTGGKTKVIDGPFTETKELLAGYWTWKVSSIEEAIEWTKRIPNPDHEDFEVEIRPVFEMDDFGDAMSPELRAQEDRQRAEIERRSKASADDAGPRSIFVNFPVKNLNRSVEFFKKLGYTFNPQFTDENATCMIVSENIYVMLLEEKYFATFTSKPVSDAKKSTETLVALSLGSRDAVNRIVEKALAAGARRVKDPQDHGFMFQWGFEDLDGHVWEYLWMDPAHVQNESNAAAR